MQNRDVRGKRFGHSEYSRGKRDSRFPISPDFVTKWTDWIPSQTVRQNCCCLKKMLIHCSSV